MKLRPESKKEFVRIAGGTSLCCAAMWVIFAALHLVNLAPFGAPVLLGGAVGSAVALANFYGICIMVQELLDEPDEARRKMILRISYNSRLLLQAVWVIVAIAAPWFHFLAGALPLLFPRITIYYLQITGRYTPASYPREPEENADDPEEETSALPGPDEGGEH